MSEQYQGSGPPPAGATAADSGAALRAGPSERLLGSVSDFPPGSRRIAIVDGVEIGVYRRGERFHAYENLCAHQGGPACEGITIGAVEPVVREDRTIAGERFSEREHIVCPWHGYEYELESGTCAHDPRLRLRRFDVVRRGDELYVVS